MQGLNRPALQSSLRDAASWFRHWIIPTTHRLHYALTYQRGWVDDRASPIRDLGTGYDLAVLQHHLGSREFDAVGCAGLPGPCMPGCCVGRAQGQRGAAHGREPSGHPHAAEATCF